MVEKKRLTKNAQEKSKGSADMKNQSKKRELKFQSIQLQGNFSH